MKYKVFTNVHGKECVAMQEDWKGGKRRDVLAPNGNFKDVELLLATKKYSLIDKPETKASK